MRFVRRLLDPDPDVQDAFIEEMNQAVRGSHKSNARAWVADYNPELWLKHPLVEPHGWREGTFEILSGQVNENLDNAITRDLSLNVASEYWNDPYDAISQLSPYRTLVAVARGVDRPDGVMWVPMGVYRVRNLSTAGSAETAIQITINAYSMENDIRDARFLETPIAGVGSGRLGVNVVREILQALVEAAFPNTSGGPLVDFQIFSEGSGLGYSFPNGSVLSDERERLDLILGLQEDRNVWGRFDRGNTYAVDTMPGVTDPPVEFTVDAGVQGVLISYSKEYNREEVYNAVLAFGEYGGEDAADPKFHVDHLAVDNDPDSPTYYYGPFGKVPRFQRVGFLPNSESESEVIVQETAENLLARALDFKAGLSLESVPNPLLEAGDVINVTFPVQRSRILLPDEEEVPEFYTERHLITNIRLGLGADTTLAVETIADGSSLPVIPRVEVMLFETPGEFTWLIPSDVFQVDVEVWGAGGGGVAEAASAFGGGGGGAYSRRTLNVRPSGSMDVTVGAGVLGDDGEESTFGNGIVKAAGGFAAVDNFGGFAGGIGNGDVIFSGGIGANTAASLGGGGGSSGTPVAPGNPGSGVDGGEGSYDSGAGGRGADSGTDNEPGEQPGGGGGSGSVLAPGGNVGTPGGDGMVRLTYMTRIPPP